MTKPNAYRWMQDIFSLTTELAHIGQFSEYRCDCLISECRKVLENICFETNNSIYTISYTTMPIRRD